MPESSVSASAVERELRTGFNMVLPSCDVHGHPIVTQQMGLLRADPSATVESLQRSGYYLMHRLLSRAEAQTKGVALLLDFSGFSFRAFRQLRLSDVRRGVRMLQDCLPARLAVVYVLHAPTWLPAVVSLISPFARTEKLTQKFVLLSSEAALHAHVPPAALPRGVGGWGGTASCDWHGTVDAWIAEERAWEQAPPDMSTRGGGGAGGRRFDPAALFGGGGANGNAPVDIGDAARAEAQHARCFDL